MFFRNTGGVVHPSSSTGLSPSDERADLLQAFQSPHVHVMQIEDACGNIQDETLELEKVVPSPPKDTELNSFWVTTSQITTDQDGLEWFFEPLQGISDLANYPVPQFEPQVAIQFQLPSPPHNSDHQATMNAAHGEGFNLLIDTHADQDNDWTCARSNMLDSLSQLDMRVLQSPFFEVDSLKMFFDLFFKHYHPHFPIIHHATFSVVACHPLLLVAILNLGSAMASDEMLFHLGQQVHYSLRLTIFNVCLQSNLPRMPIA
jgi:hypothetical protein